MKSVKRFGMQLAIPIILALSSLNIAKIGSAHDVRLKAVERREVQIPINDFLLTDQYSRPFQFHQLQGSVVLVAFIYTTCPDVCPLITAALREAQSGLKTAERKTVFLLSITTDPEIDSPKILIEYAKRHSADLANWAFLTGNEKELKKVWKNFGVGVSRKARGLVDHTPLTGIVDARGRMRFAYVGPTPDAKLLLKDARALLAER